jgi:hypothetical protein
MVGILIICVDNDTYEGKLMGDYNHSSLITINSARTCASILWLFCTHEVATQCQWRYRIRQYDRSHIVNWFLDKVGLQINTTQPKLASSE